MLCRLRRTIPLAKSLVRPFSAFKPAPSGIPHISKSNKFTDYLNTFLKRNNKSKKGKGPSDGGPKFEPKQILAFLGVSSLLIAVYYQEYIREMLGLYTSLDFQEYSRMLAIQSVESITIIKISGPNMDTHKILVRDRRAHV